MAVEGLILTDPSETDIPPNDTKTTDKDKEDDEDSECLGQNTPPLMEQEELQ